MELHLWSHTFEGEESGDGYQQQTFSPSSHPCPCADQGAHFGLVSNVKTSQDGSHRWEVGKLPQSRFLGCDLLPLPAQAYSLEGKAEAKEVNSQGEMGSEGFKERIHQNHNSNVFHIILGEKKRSYYFLKRSKLYSDSLKFSSSIVDP